MKIISLVIQAFFRTLSKPIPDPYEPGELGRIKTGIVHIHSMLDAQHLMLDAQRSMLNAQRSMLNNF